ncbi:MAG: hypothetical protein ACRYGI_12065 [Janthinobacterium lividum]
MADTEDKGLTTEGEPPKSHKDVNQPGMTNGVPDEISQGEAMGSPSSERIEGETAGQPKDADHD